MTMQRTGVDELFGLAGTLPRPGWVLLDAARDHRFTGELVVETSPPARVYLDRGSIYLAERQGDPSFGARLVDAGALTAVQLDRGVVRIGEIEHLGRLFDRVPSLDRHTVMVMAELMTEECVGWIAAQRVDDAVATPYRHHESGMHQWMRRPALADLAPGDPLPAPRVDEPPVSLSAPGEVDPERPLQAEPFLDGLIEWEEPAWFDHARLELELEQRPLPADLDLDDAFEVTSPTAGDAEDADDRPDGAIEADDGPDVVEPIDDRAGWVPIDDGPGDWIDRLVTDGLPDDDGLGPTPALPRLSVEPIERFELIWPSGDVDEQFGAVDSVVGDGHDPDADRIGATARLTRSVERVEPASDAPEAAPSPPSDPLVGDVMPDVPTDHRVDSADGADSSDEVVLAVRRAVASIEVGSLAARQRLVDAGPAAAFDGELRPTDALTAPDVPAPGRVAVRSGHNDWSRRTVSRSVFDEPPVAGELPDPPPVVVHDDAGERRSGALRRLISALRR